ncbi:MAG: hypothetical protein ACRDTC_24280 [Pseudonocardiaceae bacterium]
MTALTALALPDQVAVALLHHLESLTSSLTTPAERDRAYHQFVQLLRRWAHTMDRRNALQFFSRAALAASAAGIVDGDGYERLAAVLSGSSRVDTQTIEHIEAILRHCERQDDVLGPQAALETVLAQRDLAHSLLLDCPGSLRPQLLSALSYASREAGWLSFDLNDFTSAAYYYEGARELAHEAGNTELGATVLCNMSHLAVWQGKPRTGIDHAVAASQWINRTDDMRLRAFCADKTAGAYAADRQRDRCLATLDAAEAALGSVDEQFPSYLYAYSEAQHISYCGKCHLELGDAERAADHTRRSLAALDPSFTRTIALTTIDLARACVLSRKVDEAARLLGDAGEIAAGNSSARLAEQLQQGRAQLRPWRDTTAVRTLDERLAFCGVA